MENKHKYKVECIVNLTEWVEIDAEECGVENIDIIKKAKDIIDKRYQTGIWERSLTTVNVSEILSTQTVYENEQLKSELPEYLESLDLLDHQKMYEKKIHSY